TPHLHFAIFELDPNAGGGAAGPSTRIWFQVNADQRPKSCTIDTPPPATCTAQPSVRYSPILFSWWPPPGPSAEKVRRHWMIVPRTEPPPNWSDQPWNERHSFSAKASLPPRVSS